ncbi:MAG TPA: aspartate aminotransferase family protein [Acidimicrobiales bacterium]
MTEPDDAPTATLGEPATDAEAPVAGAAPAADGATAGLSERARRHLWMHFTRLGAYAEGEVPIIVRGEGPYVWDGRGDRKLDGLSGLFVVQAGHGRRELADAAARQAATLGYFPIWGYAHPTAVELAARLAALAPGDLNRVFFTTGGSEAVESAWKLARQYFKAIGQPQRTKVISRYLAYHGTTLGALAVTGVPALRTPFEPLTPGVFHVANTNAYRSPIGDDEDAFSEAAARAIEEAIVVEGPDTVACVFLEPVQNSGGCFTPPRGYFQRVREICDRHGVLLVSDEVICAFGRLGTMWGCERYGYQPDMITCAKGLTSGYAPLGAVLCSDRLAEPFLDGRASFLHGITFGGHPVSCAVAMANLDLFEREDLIGNVVRHEGELREAMESLRDLPIVGDVRGAGYFVAVELVRDQASKATFSDEEGEVLLRGFLSPRLYEAGLICRADDRGDPVIQLAPTLVCGSSQIDEIRSVLRTVLTEAGQRMRAGIG